MSRPDGFQIADIDVGLLDDPKFRRLWRDLHDQGLMCEAVVLFVSTLLESWSSGLRVPVDEAMPIWLDPTDGVLEGLRRVGLLTSEGFVSESGWSAGSALPPLGGSNGEPLAALEVRHGPA